MARRHLFLPLIAYVAILMFATGLAKKNANNNKKQQQLQQKNNVVTNPKDFVFLTFFNGTDASLMVNLVEGANTKKQLPTLESQLTSSSNGAGSNAQQQHFQKEFLVLQEESVIFTGNTNNNQNNNRNGNKQLPLLSAQSVALSPNGSVEYQIKGFKQGQVQSWPLFPQGRDQYQLRVCVFGDFSQSLYEDSKNLNLSGLIETEKCQMNMFIGKIAWDRKVNPKPSLNFSPYVMLHSAQDASRHQAFAHIPSLFGGTGGNKTETSYFQSTEVGDVAFLQITVEIATVAKLVDGTEAYEMIAQYFHETMLNELECKLQELHRRPKRPWIVLYMTHPYLTNGDENNVQWFVMNDTSRFFDILKRYKVDLMTSCGIEGMARMLTATRAQMPDAKLPEYIQTTMAQCSGYSSLDVSLQNECTYAVLDIHPDVIHFEKKMAEEVGSATAGKAAGKNNKKKQQKNAASKGQIQRTFEEADQCMPSDEL